MPDVDWVNVWFDGEQEAWWFDHPGEPYSEPQGNIEIPSDVLGEFFTVRETWLAELERVRAWLTDHIEASGGEHYEDFLRGDLTEDQMHARIAGCEHKRTKVETIGTWQRTQCADCGRREYGDGAWF